MSEYLRSGIRVVNPDGTPTKDFLDIFNRVVDQLGGQGRDKVDETVKSVATVAVAAENLVQGQAALDTAVQAAQAAATSAQGAASAVAADVQVVTASIDDLNTNVIPSIDARVTALEQP